MVGHTSPACQKGSSIPSISYKFMVSTYLALAYVGCKDRIDKVMSEVKIRSKYSGTDRSWTLDSFNELHLSDVRHESANRWAWVPQLKWNAGNSNQLQHDAS